MESALKSNPTKEDSRIEKNREQMGVLLLRKNEASKIVSSGSIVNMVSDRFPKCKFCVLTSDVFPTGDISLEDYYIEFWNSDSSKSIQRLKLSKFVQSNQCYRSTAGLVLIPVQPTKYSSLFKSSIFDIRRTFPTVYYNKVESKRGDDISLRCYIMGSFEATKDSLAGVLFTLTTERDVQGQLQYELHSDGSDFHTYKDIKRHFSHLCPRGSAILKGNIKDTVCIGVLNFTDADLISPVFFTQNNLTG